MVILKSLLSKLSQRPLSMGFRALSGSFVEDSCYMQTRIFVSARKDSLGDISMKQQYMVSIQYDQIPESMC